LQEEIIDFRLFRDTMSLDNLRKLCPNLTENTINAFWRGKKRIIAVSNFQKWITLFSVTTTFSNSCVFINPTITPFIWCKKLPYYPTNIPASVLKDCEIRTGKV
jgi:hypothetical protein